MKLTLGESCFIDTKKGKDISIPLTNTPDSVRAWYCDPVSIEPVKTDSFVGDVNQGGSVNFRNIKLNPHGNGTHTECVGHISKENFTLNQCLKEFHFIAALISIEPKKISNTEFNAVDNIIDAELMQNAFRQLDPKSPFKPSAIIIRTLPNAEQKLKTNYSNTNPTYFSVDAIKFLDDHKIEHLIVDLPSIDREEDNGELLAHHAFWQYPVNTKTNKTITELAYINNTIVDGLYFLDIQITSLENDASPSKLMLHELLKC